MKNKNADFQKNLSLLLRAVRGESFHFIIVQHNYYTVISDVENAITEKYPDRNLIRLNPRSEDYSSLTTKILEAKDGFVFVENFKVILEDSKFAVGFNQRRDKFSDSPIQLIVFLPMGAEVVREFVEKVPDLWSLRSLVIKLNKDFPIYGVDVDELMFEFFEEEDLKYLLSDNEIEHLKQRSLDIDNDKETLVLKEYLYAQLIDENYKRGNFSEGLNIINKWSKIVDYNNNKSLLNYYYWKGTLNFGLGNYEIADDFLQKASQIANQLEDSLMISSILNNQSQIDILRGDFVNANEKLNESLRIKTAIGDLTGSASILNNISQLYNRNGFHDEAIQYLKRALKIREETNNEAGQIEILNNLGYSLIRKENNFEEASFYLEKALLLSQKTQNIRVQGRIFSNLGQIYFQRENYQKGEEYLKKAIEILKELKDGNGLIPAYNNLSKMYLDKYNNFNKFLHYQVKAWNLAVENKNIEGIYFTGGSIGEQLCKNGNPKEGLKILKKAKGILENTDINTSQLNELIKKYEVENP